MTFWSLNKNLVLRVCAFVCRLCCNYKVRERGCSLHPKWLSLFLYSSVMLTWIYLFLLFICCSSAQCDLCVVHFKRKMPKSNTELKFPSASKYICISICLSFCVACCGYVLFSFFKSLISPLDSYSGCLWFFFLQFSIKILVCQTFLLYAALWSPWKVILNG